MRYLGFVIFLWVFSLSAWAQEKTYDFTDFAEEYLDDESAEYYELLEDLSLHPIDLNTATRQDLLQLPFISPQQADSILSYREKHHAFRSLGELLFIPELSHSDRLYLSVFTVCLPPAYARPSFRDNWLSGKHELSARADIPFYQREGIKSGAYTGSRVAHQLRYRYNNRNRIHYGLTLKNEAGEPFAKQGNRPYDALMFYLHYRSQNHRLEFVAGDYRLSAGRGLIFGNGFYLSKSSLLDSPQTGPDLFKKHSSSNQTDFFRGGAVTFREGDWSLSAFASFRRLDARLENDTARTILTTGYHRTQTELDRRRNLQNLLGGLQIGYTRPIGDIALTAYYSHYNHTVWPDARDYNAHYLRGNSAAGLSLAYNLRLRNLTLSGEGAADRKFHLALMQSLAWSPFGELTLTLQHRHLSAAFVAPYGKTVQSNSRVQNEQGVLLGAKYVYGRHWEINAYADYAHFPEPTYYASQSADCWEFYAQTKYIFSQQNNLLLRYRGRTRQRDISGHQNLLEYDQTHRIRLQLNWFFKKFDIHPSLDVALTGAQTTSDSSGYMISLRANYKPSARLKIGGFGSFFHTDNYASRLYAYEPSLRYGSGNQAFYYHGIRFSASAQWNVLHNLQVAAKFGLTNYFNQDQISTGHQAILGHNKADLNLELIWNL